MEEDECIRMLDHLQQYVPHLEKLIAQLKDPKRKNRELQLNKLEGLHSMITDRKKKLKLDTLKKCEDVILKILHKVHPNIYKQFDPTGDSLMTCNMVKFLCKDPPETTPMAKILKETGQDSDYVRFQAARARLIEITTPASPSPPRDMPLLHKPIVIPTEQVKKLDLNPDDFQIANWKNTFDVDNQKSSSRGYTDHYKSEKPDVYSQAGESLSSSSKKIIFDRLGTRVDMSKPPLSMEDLELLTSPDRDSFLDGTEKVPIEDNYSMDQLQDLREVLQKKLQQSDDKMSMPDLRNKLNNKEGTSKYKDKKVPMPVPPPAGFNSKPRSPRVEKIYKDPDSKFGNLLSSIDERILGDTPPTKKKEKKEQTKDEKSSKSESRSHEKDSKKSSSKKEHHSHDRKDSKEKKPHRDEKKDHKKDSSSKDKESDKHKSDKHKDKSKHHDKKSEEKSNKHSEANKDSKSDFKFDLSMSSNNLVQSSDASSHQTENKEAPVYKRLADKYNPRPRKNSIETFDKTVLEDTRKLVDTGQKIPVVDNIFASILNSKDNTVINNNRCEIIRPVDSRPNDPRLIPESRQINDPRQMNDPRQIPDPRQMNDPRQITDPRQMNDPRQLIDPRQMNDSRQIGDPRQMNDSRQIGDPRQMNDSRQIGDPRQINDMFPRKMEFNQINETRQNLSWFEPNTPNFESATEKPTLLGRSPLLKVIPPIQRHNSPLLPTPTTPSVMPIGFPSNNPVIRQKELIPGQSLFVPPQHNIVNQNIPANHGGNTYMNTFILQNNVSSNIQHSQFSNAAQNTFHPPVGPSKAFHPYDPIETSEYDLSKMQPTDFYSPAFTKAKRPLLSPPSTPAYPNRGPYGNPYSARERPPYMGRQNMDPWPPENKNQWLERNHPREREEPHRPVVASRDPRIRARESKDRPNYANTKEPPASHQSRRTSVEDRSFFTPQNKYDSLYANIDRAKGEKETFVSPLDSLYATGEEKAQKTGKGYGVQKFRIPKKRSDSIDKQNLKEDKDVKRDTKDLSEEKNQDQQNETWKQETIAEDSSTEVDEISVHEVVSESNKEKESPVPKEEDAPSTSEAKKSSDSSKASPTEESMLANFLTKLITKSEKKELLSAIFSTLTDNISDQQKKKFKRIQKIVDSDSDDEKEETEVKPEISDVKPPISTKDDTQPTEEPKLVDNTEAKIKDSFKDEEVKEDDESAESNDDSEYSEETAKTQTQPIKKRRNRRRAPLNRNRKRNRGLRSRKKRTARKKAVTNKKIDETTDDTESPTKTDDNVIETVGERIKNRRRNLKTPEASDTPKSRKCRTELDMLHEDIKEMFIRDGVLTATGKRMCRMLKPELDSDSNSTRSLKTRSVTSLEEEAASVLDSPKRRARASNPKVVIEKTDLSKLVSKPTDESGSDNEALESRFIKRSRSRMETRIRNDSSTPTSDLSPSPIRRTRNFKSKPNYTEDTDEELPPQLSEPEEQIVKENVTEPEPTLSPNEPPIISKEVVTVNRKGGKKKKRALTWASGIIKKRKRKPSSNPVTPTPSIDGDQHSTVSDMDEPPDTSVQDDNDSENEYIEPDVNYYFDPQDKSTCKICPFKGKMIVQHYKATHPKHEVLISRISPDNAKKAIDESVDKGYDDIDANANVTESKIRRKKYTYQCRFCQVFFKNESSELFFDHLTSHTGEYRFVCNFCPFKTAYSKSLRSHFHTSHSANMEKAGLITPAYKAPPDFHVVFGYMCGECNFIQMDKSSVVTHVKIYHLGDNQKIHKISMSMIDAKPLSLQATEGNAKTLTQVSEAEKPKQIEELQPVQEKEQIRIEKEAPKPPEETPVVELNQEVAQPDKTNKKPDIPAEIVKEDPTVFKYNGDYVQENMILEEQKHEKMKEINLTIIPRKKFTSNLLDKIKSRLDDKIPEAAVPNEETSEAASVFEEITMQGDNLNDEGTKFVKKNVNTTENSELKKQKLGLEPKTTPTDHNLEKPINNKTSVPITNIIERLQGLLNADTVQPPPLIPLNEFNIGLLEPKTEDIVIQVGPVAASKKNSYILYICYMQSCMFSSTNQSEFEIHCTTLHSNEGWDGFCNICNSKIGSFEVVNAFKHLIKIHENELKPDEGSVVIKKEPKETESPVKSYIRMRRLSGDKLSETSDNSRDNKADSNENKTSEENSTDFPFKIVGVTTQPEIELEKVTEEEHNFPFQIANVISLADKEDETSNTPSIAEPANIMDTTSTTLTGLAIINTTTNSGTSNALSAPVTTATPITFQLPIQTTSGTGYSLVLPVLSPIGNKTLIPVGKVSPTKVQSFGPVKTSIPPIPRTYSALKSTPAKTTPKKIMLKDTPLQGDDILKPRKSPSAINCMLQEHKLVHLYKCPDRSCTYSTDNKKPFEAHLAQHPTYKPGTLVCCLYCDFKTDVEFFPVHCDIRHGRCQFCCAYCFYRAINQSYVEMHQERQHSDKPRRVLMVDLNIDAQMSHAQIQTPKLQNIISPYVCGQLGCDSRFIFPEDFKEHLSTVHKGVPLLCFSCQWYPASPDNAVSHMQTHSIYHYHCRYCNFGGANCDDIYKHLSNQHFALHPKIVVRQFVPDLLDCKPSSEYSHKDPISYERMKVITEQYFKYITPAAKFDVINIKPVQNRSVKNLSGSASTSQVMAKTTAELNNSELSAVLKKLPKKQGVTLKIIEQLSIINKKNTIVDQKKSEPSKQNDNEENDSDVEIVDDEPSSASVKPLKAIQIAAKQSTDTLKSMSPPIVLNSLLGSPPGFLTLTQDLAAGNKITKSRDKPKSTLVTSKETTTEQNKATDYIVIQPVSSISLDDPTVDMRIEPINNTSADDVDPLQLESEACTVIPEDSIAEIPTEPTFTEAKLDIMTNYGFVEDGEEFSDLTPEEAKLAYTNYETMRKQGLMGRDLFRCGFCRAGFENSSLFKTHVTKCVEVNKNGIPRPFKCAHCIKAFKSLGTLLDHVRLHGTLRFSCSLCDFKHQHQFYVRSHLKNRHKITSVSLMPVDPNKRCLDEDEFVVRVKMNRQRSFDNSSGSKDLSGNGSADETGVNKPAKASYGPDEIASVPIRPIFSKEVKCSACGYLTKVRANLIRHLQFHSTGKEMSVPVTAPINPVPCLEKNEKMFDKMTNLSLSSYNDAVRLASKVEKLEKPGLSKEEEAQLPAFVPLTKRYVCGASICDYLCLEESMLRYHLLALHTDESFYKCMHCDEKLSSEKGVINVEFIIKHLRLHDLHLYKCRYCKFLHQLKHKVDRHVLDKHSDKPPVVIIVRELEQEPEESQEQHEEVKETKEAKPWRCGMCKYRCTNKKEIIAHAYNKHDVDIQFKCALCQFTNNTKSAFTEHFENDHPGQNIDVIDAYYEIEETVTSLKPVVEGPHFDTTPLWQRDKNKFKHIRGIPLDESKLPKKSPMKIANSSDNLDKAIEAVASGIAEVADKNQLLKKPKTLKEKKMEIRITSENDIIEVDDDEEKNMAAKIAGVTKNLFNRRMSDISNPITEIFKETKPEENIMEDTRRRSLPELITKLQEGPVVDEDAVDISLKEIEEMDLETLKNMELTGTYGPFGKPSFKQFLCPLCSTFKTKKVEDITNHLYKELHYFRFVCTNCALTGITFNFLHRHSIKKHLTESIHPLSPNPRIEQWVKKVLAIQRRIIESNESPFASPVVSPGKSKNVGGLKSETKVSNEPQKSAVNTKTATEINLADSSTVLDSEGVVNKAKSTSTIHQCKYCSYSCKAASDLRKHERRHWVQKPLKCGHCDVEGVTKYEVLQHARRAHPNLEQLVIPVPMPSTPTIKPITRKRKYPKSLWDNTNSNDEVSAKQPATETSESSSKDPSPSIKEDEFDSDDYAFLCSHCSKPYNTKEELKLHWDSIYKSKLTLLKFKRVPRSQLDDTPEATSESSSYIDDDIENESEDIIVYICNYCPKRCNSETETRQHWEAMHKTKQPAFKYKKLMRSQLLKKGSLNYKCCYCEFIGHLETIKRHFMMKHPSLAFSVFRYKCGYCGCYLRNVEKAKIHCKHIHGVAEASYVNIDEDTIKELDIEVKDFVCEHCLMEFDLRKELVDHHKALHSHLELNLAPDLTPHAPIQDDPDEMKMYMCPECQHSSNSYAAMRDHLRNHAKPYQCGYCTTRFSYPSLLKSHQAKDHPNSEHKCITIEEAKSINENLRKNLLVLTKEGTYEKYSLTKAPRKLKGEPGYQPRKIRVVESGDDVLTTIKTKKVARKSTTQGVRRNIDEGFSYYGTKPDLSGLDNVKTTVSFMDSMVTMNIAQFRGFLNISPTVPVVDIVKYKDEL